MAAGRAQPISLLVIRGLLAASLVAACGLAFAHRAEAAQLIDRDAVGVHISLDSKGEALLTYRKGGVTKHVLVWGAVNALAPSAGGHQVKFHLDYSGGWGRYHTLYWRHFKGTCAAYDGPELANLVAAC